MVDVVIFPQNNTNFKSMWDLEYSSFVQPSVMCQKLDLQKRIGNATDIVIGRVSHGKQIAEEFDEGGDEA